MDLQSLPFNHVPTFRSRRVDWGCRDDRYRHSAAKEKFKLRHALLCFANYISALIRGPYRIGSAPASRLQHPGRTQIGAESEEKWGFSLADSQSAVQSVCSTQWLAHDNKLT